MENSSTTPFVTLAVHRPSAARLAQLPSSFYIAMHRRDFSAGKFVFFQVRGGPGGHVLE